MSDITAIVDEISSTPLALSNSRIPRFLTDIRSKVDNKETQVLIEDLGPEETLHGINPLPVDSPLLLVGTVDVGRHRDGSRWEGRVVREEIATPNETSQGNITVLVTSFSETAMNIRIPFCNVRQLNGILRNVFEKDALTEHKKF